MRLVYIQTHTTHTYPHTLHAHATHRISLAQIIREITIREEESIYQTNKKPENAISEIAVFLQEKNHPETSNCIIFFLCEFE